MFLYFCYLVSSSYIFCKRSWNKAEKHAWRVKKTMINSSFILPRDILAAFPYHTSMPHCSLTITTMYTVPVTLFWLQTVLLPAQWCWAGDFYWFFFYYLPPLCLLREFIADDMRKYIVWGVHSFLCSCCLTMVFNFPYSKSLITIVEWMCVFQAKPGPSYHLWAIETLLSLCLRLGIYHHPHTVITSYWWGTPWEWVQQQTSWSNIWPTDWIWLVSTCYLTPDQCWEYFSTDEHKAF